MDHRLPPDDDMEDMPTPQELSQELHAVEEAVAAVERAERDQLVQPWTHTPMPGDDIVPMVFSMVSLSVCLS